MVITGLQEFEFIPFHAWRSKRDWISTAGRTEGYR